MKTIYFLIINFITFGIYANFFGDFVPTPKRMMSFYNSYAPDMFPVFDREKRLENQVADSVIDGDVIHLKTKERDIFSIFMESEEETDTGVIFLHSRGEHPNDEKLIKPLRVNFAEQGYHSLSVQMPVLEKTAKYYDYVPIFIYSHPRIIAAINFYKKMGMKKIIIVAHGCGGHMLMSFLDRYGDKNIDAVVGIGMGATYTNQEVVARYPMSKINIPVLDIFGAYDYPSVKKHAKLRANILNKNSEQIKLPKAKHYHGSGVEFEQLTTTIYNWLDKKLK